MVTLRRASIWVAVAVAVAGCRTPGAVPATGPSGPPPPPLDLAPVAAGSLEPDYKTLPSLDPVGADAGRLAPIPAYRGLTEDVCRREAAARAPLARVLVQENLVPGTADGPCTAAAEEMLREVRTALAAEARNRAAAQALETYFQLADAEGRGDLVRASLPALDQLREIVRKAKADGVRVPVDPDDLDRQRATLLGLLTQADLGAKVFDLELRRRVGFTGKGNERIRPVGPFTVGADTADLDAAIKVALENRADLRVLRAVYLRLSPDTLPAVRDIIRAQPGVAAMVAGGKSPLAGLTGPLRCWLHRHELAGLDAALAAEVTIRRQQLYDLIAERERQAADDVRAAAAAEGAQAKQVALAKWRAEQLLKKVTDVKAQGPLVVLPAELEAYRARADVVAGVMAWHQARVRLAAAQGLLGEVEPAK